MGQILRRSKFFGGWCGPIKFTEGEFFVLIDFEGHDDVTITFRPLVAKAYHVGCPEIELGCASSPAVIFPRGLGGGFISSYTHMFSRLEHGTVGWTRGDELIIEVLEEFEREVIRKSLEMAKSNLAKLRGEK